MTALNTQNNEGILAATMALVRTHLQHCPMPPAEIPGFIEGVYKNMASLMPAQAAQQAAPQTVAATEVVVAPAACEPAVDPRKSVMNDYIISLEDGSRHVMMKRYLRGLGMTPSQYRAKWGLPDNYPMVAPGYSKRKSLEAHRVGLGHAENKKGINMRVDVGSHAHAMA